MRSLLVMCVSSAVAMAQPYRPYRWTPGPHAQSAPDDQTMINRVIQQHAGKFHACYEAERKTQPQLAGKVTATFLIGAGGQVLNASASGLDVNVDACVEGVVKNVIFVKPRDGKPITVNHPFTFKPPGK